jgi:cell division protein FtsB
MSVLACLGLTAYFGFHAVNGRHGLDARQRIVQRLPQVERDLARLDAERALLRRDVALLSPELPSRDMVEEIARDVLGFVLPTEIVWLGR